MGRSANPAVSKRVNRGLTPGPGLRSGKREHSQPSVRALERGLGIIQHLNGFGPLPCAELARLSGLNRITTFRLLETLKSLGYIARDPKSKSYFLAERVLGLSDGYKRDNWIGGPVRLYVEQCADEVEWPVLFTTNSGSHMIVRASTRSDSPYNFTKRGLGQRIPILASSVGLCYLAFAPKRIRRDLIMLALSERPEANLMTRKQMDKEADAIEESLNVSRERGFAYLESSWKTEGIDTSAIAVPVMHGKQLLGTLGITFFRAAMTLAQAKKQLLPHMQATADLISRAAALQLRPTSSGALADTQG
jgi:IclR family mhp operon transcriptional activator